jgi:hypothetical protein
VNFTRKLAFIAAPAVLALVGGAMAVHAAITPNPNPSHAAREAAEPAEATGAEAPETAAKPEATEAPGTVDVGHADLAGDVNHEATGEEK